MTPLSSSSEKRHILTIALEDYFHVGAFNQFIQRERWYRFPTRFEENTRKALDLLDQFQVKATFFVLGWIADKQPDIVKEVVRRGHEVASRGYYHRSIRQMTREEFREDVVRARDAVERASGAHVLGYRLAHQWLAPTDLWALDVLAEEGYAYDSSILPSWRLFHTEKNSRFVHLRRCGSREIWEIPLSTHSIVGWNIPIAGGNYFRQFPHTLMKRAVQHWHETYTAPFVLYFHVWELDPDQPNIDAASPLARIRHYRNLDKMRWVLEDYFRTYRFAGVAESVGITPRTIETPSVTVRMSEIEIQTQNVTGAESAQHAAGLHTSGQRRIPVSVVIPCFNEELVLPYLANTLRSVEKTLTVDSDLRFIFVDDGSSDGTWDALQYLFGAQDNCTLLRHTQNHGVARAILTGIHAATTDIVCSIDCDCTYDPHELRHMVPLLSEGVDLVTASPYHPQGKVLNVPAWRLALSKAASSLYRCVIPQRLATYTSCFRVYRKKAIVDLPLTESGFLGIAELVCQLGLRNAHIVEYPAVLEVRVLGHSKMKVLRTIRGHVWLLSRLLLQRVFAKNTRVCALNTHAHSLSSSHTCVAEPSISPTKESLHE